MKLVTEDLNHGSRLRSSRAVAHHPVGIAIALVALVVASSTTACRQTPVAVCDAGAVCSRVCSIDSDCDVGECVEGLCQDALPIDPNDGSAGVVSVQPGLTIDLGNPPADEEVVRTATIENVGLGPFILQAVTPRSPSANASATALTSLPAFIAAGASVEVLFRFSRAEGGVASATFEVTTNAGACDFDCADPTRFEITLTTGFIAPTGGISLSPSTHDFGLNAPGTAADSVTLSLQNLDLEAEVEIEAASVSGDVAAFDVGLPSTPLTLGAGGSQAIEVRYIADAPGEHAITVAVSTSVGEVESQLSGRVGEVGSGLVFSPASLSFDVTAVGTSETKQVSIQNTAASAVQLAALDVTGPAPAESVFTITSSALPLSLAAGASTSVDVTLTPTSLDGLVASLVATTAAGDNASLSLVALAGDAPVGANLDVIVGPKTVWDSECGCQATPTISSANVDVVYRAIAGGAECKKPDDASCGVGGECACPTMNSFGSVTWGSGRTEVVRGSEWIIDEQVRHSGGGDDGTFVVQVDLADDCLSVPGSTTTSTNVACCQIDCDPAFNPGAPQACFDYGPFPSCASFCSSAASEVTAADCFARGPIAIRTIIRVSGGTAIYDRHFCSTLNESGDSMNVVEVVRTGGLFQVGAVLAGVVEVDPSVACLP